MSTKPLSPKTQNGLRVARALGVTDPFGSQINLYRAALRILKNEYEARLSYHYLKPDWTKVEAVARETRREAKTSLLGLWQFKVRALALQQIEATQITKPAAGSKSTAVNDVAAQMLEALGT